ncbi:bacteriocin [Nitrosococcus wardiae]|uniref:Bacteriocin n=2 Tax=Nitrosococcus wardiae TaxID=1814290 RepID=A0A4P7C4C5_9GAMM|nr:bacteriocin [Nitrosococcus wardiae]
MAGDLNRDFAPISEKAWEEITGDATRTLKASLAARKLVDFSGPHGWTKSAVPMGRVDLLPDIGGQGVRALIRQVQPLVELRASFTLKRDEIDAIGRGAEDANLEPLIEAAQHLAHTEDRLIFYGHENAGIRGIYTHAKHRPLTLTNDYNAYPEVVAHALAILTEAAIEGPYAIALGTRCFIGLNRTTGVGGYPVIKHVERLLDGPIVRAPSINGALVLSMRGNDFKMVVGRDISIGYASHNATTVDLYLEESLTFRLLSPEAAVPLVYEESSP